MFLLNSSVCCPPAFIDTSIPNCREFAFDFNFGATRSAAYSSSVYGSDVVSGFINSECILLIAEYLAKRRIWVSSIFAIRVGDLNASAMKQCRLFGSAVTWAVYFAQLLVIIANGFFLIFFSACNIFAEFRRGIYFAWVMFSTTGHRRVSKSVTRIVRSSS